MWCKEVWREIRYRRNYLVMGSVVLIYKIIEERGYVVYKVGKYLDSGEMYYMGVGESLEVMLRLCMLIYMILIIPLVWCEVVLVVVRGLYRSEAVGLIKVTVMSCILVIVGIKVVEEVVLRGIERAVGAIVKVEGVEHMEYIKEIKKYVRVIEEVTRGVIVVSQIPVLIWIWCKWWRGGKEGLSEKRRWVYCGVMIVGGMVTPPEVLSQVVVGVVVGVVYESWVIYEVYKRYKKEIWKERN